MRAIAYKGEGGLILAIFVRTYYEDDPPPYTFLLLFRIAESLQCILNGFVTTKKLPATNKRRGNMRNLLKVQSH